MKYFVVSDIHNCYDELIKALADNGFCEDNSNHKIIFLGDAFEKGPKPKETYLFLADMLNRDKMVWVRGNHDIEIVNAVKKCELNKTNRSTALAIAKVLDAELTETASDEEICKALAKKGFDSWVLNNSKDFFELEQYVFVHGFIPLNKECYDENWRALPSEKWGGARKKCAVRAILKDGIKIPDKTVVCGHVGAYYGHIKAKHMQLEFDSPEFKRVATKITSNSGNRR